jgi:ribosomal protein S27E
MKPETNITCEKCGHKWFTNSKMIKLNCPSCRKITSNTTLETKQ